MLHSLLHPLLVTWFGWVETWGYLGVFLLMVMESSIIPVPSEIVMPPAAYWAAQGRMSFAGVVLAGTAGSWVGSALTYFVARRVGQPVVLKYGRYFLLPPAKLQAAEAWLDRYGAFGVFIARFLPVVRHLISIPAGVLRMPFALFSFVTVVGAGLWCLILSWFGAQVIGTRPELLQSPEMLIAVIKAKLAWFVGAVVVLGALYAVFARFAGRSNAVSPT